MNLIFIGFRGTGKSTLGKRVARMLDRRFVDIDVYIEKKEGKQIKEIFEDGGEKRFRELEIEAVEAVCMSDDMVIATGGGAVINEINVKNLKRNGFVVLLESDPDIIYRRISRNKARSTQRPALTERDPADEIKHLLASRYELYHKCADLVLDTSKNSLGSVSKTVVTVFKEKMEGL